MSYWIDTHAHIYSEEFKKDVDDMLRRCEESKVKKIYMPNIDHTSIDDMLALEEKYSGRCVATMGLHPCYVKKDFQRELYIVEDWLSKRQFAAVGEIGTDLYWDKTLWGYQEEAFRIQVGWAKHYGLPIIIHCRESLDETIKIVEELKNERLKGVFHCFGGSVEQAKKIIALGFYLGIGGIVTFKKAGLDKLLPEISLEHLVLETDSPYLAPVPHRGKRNEPSYIPIIAGEIATIKQIEVVEVMNATFKNTSDLFSPITQ